MEEKSWKVSLKHYWLKDYKYMLVGSYRNKHTSIDYLMALFFNGIELNFALLNSAYTTSTCCCLRHLPMSTGRTLTIKQVSLPYFDVWCDICIIRLCRDSISTPVNTFSILSLYPHPQTYCSFFTSVHHLHSFHSIMSPFVPFSAFMTPLVSVQLSWPFFFCPTSFIFCVSLLSSPV